MDSLYKKSEILDLLLFQKSSTHHGRMKGQEQEVDRTESQESLENREKTEDRPEEEMKT